MEKWEGGWGGVSVLGSLWVSQVLSGRESGRYLIVIASMERTEAGPVRKFLIYLVFLFSSPFPLCTRHPPLTPPASLRGGICGGEGGARGRGREMRAIVSARLYRRGHSQVWGCWFLAGRCARPGILASSCPKFSFSPHSHHLTPLHQNLTSSHLHPPPHPNLSKMKIRHFHQTSIQILSPLHSRRSNLI